MLNAKLECHLAGPHTLLHEVSERETFCNNFYSTIFLPKKKDLRITKHLKEREREI